MNTRRHIVFLLLTLAISYARGAVYFNGSIQHDGLFPTTDISSTRTEPRAAWAKIDHLSNNYLDFSVRYTHENDSNRIKFRGITANTRIEINDWPLPGYEAAFKGHGISHLSAAMDFEWGQISIGDIYGQFGAGMILCLYEDRALGVDNALRGAKFIINPYKGIQMTLLGGKQRRYWNCYSDHAWGWNYTEDAALGANLELNIHDWSPRMAEKEIYLTFGGSYVSKYEQEDTIFTLIGDKMYRYNLPRWVGAGDIRFGLQVKGIDFLAEYAYKANDPCADNLFSYRPGEALLLSLSYSRKGMSVLAQAKRSENMSFRSERQRRGIAGRLNHMPAFAQQHTYTLAALYPYATQYADGEWAFQAELRYSWKRKTPMGGKYGTSIKIGGSHIRGLAKENSWLINTDTEGEYYSDINIELNKRITKHWWLNAMVMYQTYNQRIVEGKGDLIRSAIAVLDSKVQISNNVTMRNELQYMYTRQYQGQWIFALCELNLWSHWSISGQWMYNIGRAAHATHEHFYTASVGYTQGAHRVMIGYTKTRDGYNCSGGICRYVPRQEGVSMSYNFTW